MKDLKYHIERYFKLTDEEKDELLVEIVDTYKVLVETKYHNNVSIMDLIDHDIELFLEHDDFEATQALTDIKNTIIKVQQDLENGRV